jgi:diguanylate cyclase (GGDEF)-like protein
MGDFVLVECVKMLKECFNRPNDFVARIGGEEFAVIVPDTSLEGALALAQSVLDKVRAETLVQDDMRIKFTISIGIAPLMKSESIEHWVKRADEALYDSKNSGRNKFTVASPQLQKKTA